VCLRSRCFASSKESPRHPAALGLIAFIVHMVGLAEEKRLRKEEAKRLKRRARGARESNRAVPDVMTLQRWQPSLVICWRSL